MLHTTLNLLKTNGACGQGTDEDKGYNKLRKYIGTDYPKGKEIALATILESNGIADTLWAFRAVPVEQFDYAGKVLSLYTADCLELIVKELSKDEKFAKEFPEIDKVLKEAPGIIRSYWRGEIGKKEVTAAYNRAYRAYLAYLAYRADLAYRAYLADLADLADPAYRADLADRADPAYLADRADREKFTSTLRAYLRDEVDLSSYTRRFQTKKWQG